VGRIGLRAVGGDRFRVERGRVDAQPGAGLHHVDDNPSKHQGHRREDHEVN
jgi:hypothetical protein